MIRIDGKKVNLEGSDELLMCEAALLIGMIDSRLGSKGRRNEEIKAYMGEVLARGLAGDTEKLRQKAQIEKEKGEK